MPYFPQLTTGCTVQYPVAKHHIPRAIVNDAVDGNRIVAFDWTKGLFEWDLRYSGLSASEATSLESFFKTVEGRLTRFVFPDPMGNLLARSEEFTQAPWLNDPMLQWTAGIADPLGTTRAQRVVNAGAVTQSMSQSVDIPGSYLLCFSFWARSAASATVTARRTAGASSHSNPFAVDATWRRFQISATLASSTAPVLFFLDFPAGASVELFAMQLEGQREATAYRKTSQYASLYPTARFAQDELVLVAQGFGSYATRLRVTSPREG